MYGLIVITGIGATTLLGTYSSQTECLQASATVFSTANATTQCWPGESEYTIKENVKQINSALNTVVKK